MSESRNIRLLSEPPGVSHHGLQGFLADLGPGLVTGAADDDPSGISTYSVAGAAYGYATLWTALLSFPLMADRWPRSQDAESTTKLGAPCLDFETWETATLTLCLFRVAQMLRELISPQKCCPLALNLNRSLQACGVMTEAGPRPNFRLFDKSSLDRAAVHVPEFLNALLIMVYVEVIVSRLPEGPLPALNGDRQLQRLNRL